MKKRIILIIVISIVLFSSSSYASISNEEWIRIGLKAMYEKVPSINVKNTSISINYFEGSDLKSEITCDSNSGFIFKPTNKKYLASNETLNSYNKAVESVNNIKNDGIDAFPLSLSYGCWKVLVCGQDDVQTGDLLETINDKYGLIFSIVEDNGLRVLMTGENDTVIFDNTIVHPQITTNNSLQEVQCIDLGERQYRGRIEIGRYGKEGLTAVNSIKIEEYLYGILPSEMPASFPKEALKAQAVAARSFAYYNRDNANKYPKDPYDLCDTISSQVYKGYTAEDSICNSAVNETKNKKVYYNNKLISTNFFSSSGGHTEDSENVWSASPYLRGVPDTYEIGNGMKSWIVELSSEKVKELLAKKSTNIGDIIDIIPIEYTNSGRVKELKFIGTEGEKIVSRLDARTWLGLNSSKYKIVSNNLPAPKKVKAMSSDNAIKDINIKDLNVINGNNVISKPADKLEQILTISEENVDCIPLINAEEHQFMFFGQGYGHAVGMSQIGAKGMALSGYLYDEIIKYYYTGVEVK